MSVMYWIGAIQLKSDLAWPYTQCSSKMFHILVSFIDHFNKRQTSVRCFNGLSTQRTNYTVFPLSLSCRCPLGSRACERERAPIGGGRQRQPASRLRVSALVNLSSQPAEQARSDAPSFLCCSSSSLSRRKKNMWLSRHNVSSGVSLWNNKKNQWNGGGLSPPRDRSGLFWGGEKE